MQRKLTENEINVIKLIKQQKTVTYSDIEKAITVENSDLMWSTFSVICSLKESNFINMTKSPSKYFLTEYAEVKLKDI